MQCNLCGGSSFAEYRGRPHERCTNCGAKARHRVALDVYDRFLGMEGEGRSVLHLAPESFLHPIMKSRFGAGYVTADASPERYPHAQAIKLFLPQGFDIFPEGYFDAILHNHVVEHIPGSFRDHLPAFARILAPGGLMIFSVPGPYAIPQTIEGGETLASDAERLEKFLQEDHYKLFGADFRTFVAAMPGGELLDDGVTDARRAELAVRPGKCPMFVWRKDAA